MNKLILLDSNSLIYRAFHALPPLTNSKGQNTGAVFGFVNMLTGLIEQEKPTHIAAAFDLKAPTFRHAMFDGYKATRKPMPDELAEQLPYVKRILSSMKIKILELEGFEADDILGTVAKRFACPTLIVSGDRDCLQLVSESTHVYLTKKGIKDVEVYSLARLKEDGFTPLSFIDFKALKGDASDNIPGVPSIGQKTATSLIVQFHSLENLYAHLDEVKPPRAKKALEENQELAKLSYTLAKICTEAPVEFSAADAKAGDLFTPEAYELVKQLGFKSIAAKFGEAARKENSLEENFHGIEAFEEAEAVFAKAEAHVSGGGRAGAQLIAEKGAIVGAALCFSEEDSYWIKSGGLLTGGFLAGRLADLCRLGEVWMLDLKGSLPFLGLSYGDTVYDAGVAAYLLNPLKDTYEYDDIARDYLGISVPSRGDLLKKMTFEAAWEQEPKTALVCAGYMAHTAYMAGPPLLEKLRELVRREELHAYGVRLKEKIRVLEQEIWEMTGEQFNINSPKQLGEILFDKMKIKGGKKTKTGYSTAADVLEKLAPDYPVIEKILEYRQYTKLNSTYAEGLESFIAEDGRIHSRFNQTITATGRISSTEPNLQNIPIRMELGREIRKVFVPKEGFVFLDADYSQIELRVLAHLSGDERLIEAYKSAQDIHAITASEVFHVPLNEVTPLQRRNAKAVNFGIVYGISAFGLSEDLSITRKEALEYINKYFETYPQVKIFLDGLVEHAKEQGYVTTMFGRRRPVPELKSANFMQRSFGERVAMNSPIQGTAADIIKIAMIRVDRRLREEGLSSRLILQVHDELLVETAVLELEQVKKILSEEMRQAAKLKVELEIDMHSGNSWFEAK